MPTYYPINETLARQANMMNSYYEYKAGSATAEYQAMVDKAAAIAEEQKSRTDPMYHDKIDHLLDTYARKLAENFNENFEIQTRCPSILVAGRANFPIRKKEKQNAASDRNTEAFCRIQSLRARITELEQRQTAPAPEGWTFNGGKVVMNREENRVQIIFDGKPDADVRAALKQNGFRWAPSQGAWQRMLTQNGICAARQVTEAWMPVESEQAVVEEPETAPVAWEVRDAHRPDCRGRPQRFSQSGTHAAVHMAQAAGRCRGMVERLHALRQSLQIQGVHLHAGF